MFAQLGTWNAAHLIRGSGQHTSTNKNVPRI